MATVTFRPAFTEYIPPDLEAGILYISLTYATAVHLCPCGCARKVVTPLSPADWQFTFDGTVSIRPSVGNWQYPCQSHYFIRSNQVVWAKRFTQRPGHDMSSTRRRRPAGALRIYHCLESVPTVAQLPFHTADEPNAATLTGCSERPHPNGGEAPPAT